MVMGRQLRQPALEPVMDATAAALDLLDYWRFVVHSVKADDLSRARARKHVEVALTELRAAASCLDRGPVEAA